MNTKQRALIKKDIRSITSNKQVFSVMLIVPLALTVVLPTIFVLVTLFAPDTASDYEKLLAMLPMAEQVGDPENRILGLILNKVMPVFFMIIPVMASSVMAASSFVGEKEKHTLETLLYSPLSLNQLFQAKIIACFFVGMMVSVISFAAMILVVELEVILLLGTPILPDLCWLIVMLLVAPAISLIAINITVRGSAKSQTMEEAQQRAVFLIFPIIALVVGQFTGVIMINAWILLGVGIVVAFLAAWLMKGAVGKFTYEKLLGS